MYRLQLIRTVRTDKTTVLTDIVQLIRTDKFDNLIHVVENNRADSCVVVTAHIPGTYTVIIMMHAAQMLSTCLL